MTLVANCMSPVIDYMYWISSLPPAMIRFAPLTGEPKNGVCEAKKGQFGEEE